VKTQQAQQYDGWLGKLLAECPEDGYADLTAAFVACLDTWLAEESITQ